MRKEIEIDLKIVGNRIRQARKRLMKTQEHISEIADISAQYWSAVETGRDRGSVNTYLQIAAALGVTLNDLFYSEAELIRMEKTDFEESLIECSEYEKTVLIEAILVFKNSLIHCRKLL